MIASIRSTTAIGIVASLSCGLAAFSTAPLAASGDKIGSAVAITNLVTVEYAKERRELTQGDNVRQDELVEVSANSQGEFRLDDNTMLALGPGARLLLDKFVYDSDKRAGSIVVNLVKGTFRFITGVAARSTYIVRTPTAAITVRGTVFDVFVLDDNSTLLLLHEGAIEVRGVGNGGCRVLDRPGYLVRVLPNGRVGAPVNWQRLPARTYAFDAAFPFVAQPPSIDPRPHLTRPAIVDAAYRPHRASACRTAVPVVPGLRRIDPPPQRRQPERVRKARVDRDVDIVRTRPVRVAKKPPPKRPKSPPGRNPDRRTEAGGLPIGIVIGIGGFRPGGRGIGPRRPTPNFGGRQRR